MSGVGPHTVPRKNHKTDIRTAIVLLLSITVLVGAVHFARAAEITSATLDSDVYLAGQQGYVSASVYNDNGGLIRITELSATVDYYYEDGTVYVQKFFTSVTLPSEISPGQTETFRIPISLPTNIASGYIDLTVEARTDLYVNLTDRWIGFGRTTYETKLFIESPYKQSYEDSQKQLQDTQTLLEEQKVESRNLGITAIVLAVMIFAVVGFAAFLMFTLRRPKPVPLAQP